MIIYYERYVVVQAAEAVDNEEKEWDTSI
jgi:hypothetical protein